jgi:hypothetical protein
LGGAWITVTVFTTIALNVSAMHLAAAADAPYGFAWSQARESLPQPSYAISDANVTQLIYQGPDLPRAMKDTDAVALTICEGHGLQQVRWVSRPYTRTGAINKFLDIYEVGVKRHGEADLGNLDIGTAGWTRERISMMVDRDEQRDVYRIIMFSDGPLFETCEGDHRRKSGHQDREPE